MNYKKVTFNKIIVSAVCITTMPLCASEYYSASADAKTRREIVNGMMAFPTYGNKLQDLTLRKAVLDKDLSQVKDLLTQYHKNTMPYEIIDDALASIEETSYYASFKWPLIKITGGTVGTAGGVIGLTTLLKNKKTLLMQIQSSLD